MESARSLPLKPKPQAGAHDCGLGNAVATVVQIDSAERIEDFIYIRAQNRLHFQLHNDPPCAATPYGIVARGGVSCRPWLAPVQACEVLIDWYGLVPSRVQGVDFPEVKCLEQNLPAALFENDPACCGLHAVGALK